MRTSRIAARAVVVVTVSSILASPASSARHRESTRSVDVRGSTAVLVRNAYGYGDAGDVNGDGVTDWIFASGRSLRARDPGAARATRRPTFWVVFASEGRDRINLRDREVHGFPIIGDHPGTGFTDVVPLGDVNGDGFGDIAIGELYGTIFVVFGKGGERPVHLAEVGTNGDRKGYRIVSHQDNADMANVGDINGDGRDDLAIDAWGRVYVFFTQPRGFTPLGLPYELRWWDEGIQDELGDLGFRMPYRVPSETSHAELAGPGDVNGDGTLDIVVGLPGKWYEKGETYVVFGKTTGSDVPLPVRGDAGFVIKAGRDWENSGFALAGPGDVNGDGLGDVLIGAPHFAASGKQAMWGRGAAYVVFGKRGTEPVRLDALGKDGFEIKEPVRPGDGERVGVDVAPAGDANADGLADLLVGAYNASHSERRVNSGAAYVVFGKRTSKPVSVARLGRHGYRLWGPWAGAGAGSPIFGVPDTSGDGRFEYMVNSVFRRRRGAISMTHIVWGRGLPDR